MSTQKYSVNQHLIETILAWVNAGEIAIPEIQRPFVWSSSKVRDLLDSLYQGYPIGYLIAWRNPNVRLKDGTTSDGKKILIDGQQRVTAMRAAILGEEVIDQDYRRVKIAISFNPLTEIFEVRNPAIEKNKAWIPDIGPIIRNEVKLSKSVKEYSKVNPEADEDVVEDRIEHLRSLGKRQVGLIELASDLPIETVTEVFIRINAQGVVLSQADFAMSKIASNEKHGGPTLRKAIDYFCHLAVAPDFYPTLCKLDSDFTKTQYFGKMKWLKEENDDLYDPSYTDMLRVAFTSQFGRGRFADLVSLLSGRNFETREYEDAIAEESFNKLSHGIMEFMSETHFKRFLMIVRSAGFTSSGLIRSQNVLNMGYVLYLALRGRKEKPALIENYVKRWIVMSILTGRYSGQAESRIDRDIKAITDRDVGEVLRELERAELSDAFWEAGLVQALNVASMNSPLIGIFWAAQVKANDKGFLSKDIRVGDMIVHQGDIHHIFPREYLKRHGMARGRYNQIANFAYTQTEINIQIGKQAPCEYFSKVKKQCAGEEPNLGGIQDLKTLEKNLAANAVPQMVMEATADNYDAFLLERRELMAKKIKKFYQSL